MGLYIHQYVSSKGEFVYMSIHAVFLLIFTLCIFHLYFTQSLGNIFSNQGLNQKKLDSCKETDSQYVLHKTHSKRVIFKNENDIISFFGEGWIRLSICTNGKINITLKGQDALDIPPILSILSTESEYNTKKYNISGRKLISFYVNKGENLFLGFVNDTSKFNSQSVKITTSSFNGHNCSSLKIYPNSKEDAKIFLTGDDIVELSPCSFGNLTLKISNNNLKIQPPVLMIYERSRVIKKILVPNTKHTINLNLNINNAIHLKLEKPLMKTLYDRNLFIEKIELTKERNHEYSKKVP